MDGELRKGNARVPWKKCNHFKRTRNKVQENLSLEQLRKEYQTNQTEQLDLLDIGGCGCFVNYD
jgi:hypothetical protein